MNNVEFKSRIDTLETKEPISNRCNLDNLDIKGIETHFSKDMNIITKYNPNNFDYNYSKEYKLSKTIEDLNKMQEALTIIDTNMIDIRRIDIATDLNVNFDDISKFLDLVHRCIRAKEKEGMAWSNVTETDLKASNYLYRNRFKLEIEFYNKHKENPKANYPTRMEIRFLRISSKDFKLHINNSIALWKFMPNNLEDIEQQMIELLKARWIEERTINPGLTFSTFVYKYSNYIYTQNILKSLYNETGLKRDFRYWLQDYKKKYSITFYTKSDLNNFSKNVVKSLKEYAKN